MQILQAQLLAHQRAYLSQPVYLKKIVWSGVRLLSLSESYYPPKVTTPGNPNQSYILTYYHES